MWRRLASSASRPARTGHARRPIVGHRANVALYGVALGTGLFVAWNSLHDYEAEETEQPISLNKYIDHTLLKADATPAEIIKLCEEAVQYDFASVCVNGVYAKLAWDTIQNLNPSSTVKVCCVVGFPLGAMSTQMKAAEATYCLEQGASEIDMVIAVGKLKAGEHDYVLRDISAVVTACKAKGAACKVIIETALLTKEQISQVSELAVRAGADFVKTSTGFSTGGATVEDVALMASIAHPAGKEVKASGGIRNRETALAMVNAGATRIGASAGVVICSGGQVSKTGY